MTGDPNGFHDRAKHVSDVLRSMESDFLSILAEHQRGGPSEHKEHNGFPKDESEVAGLRDSGTGTSTAGNTRKAQVVLRSSEEVANVYLNSLICYHATGCPDCRDGLIDFAQMAITSLITEGIENYGWEK